MNLKIQQLGIRLVPRPKIKAIKLLYFSGAEGKQIVLAETIRVLKTHAKTFSMLADM